MTRTVRGIVTRIGRGIVTRIVRGIVTRPVSGRPAAAIPAPPAEPDSGCGPQLDCRPVTTILRTDGSGENPGETRVA
jgi:hypothetical protein